MPARTRRARKKAPLSVGDRVEEITPVNGKVRVGEIILVRDGRRRSFELIQLNPHDLEPIRRGDFAQYKRFRLTEGHCRRLNKAKYANRRTFRIGDVIRKTYLDHVRYGRIINFLHPDGLLPTSHENGYNGKDLLECVEISSKPGLLQVIQPDGEPKRFQAHGKDCKIMDVITVDSKGEETTMHRLNIPEDEDA